MNISIIQRSSKCKTKTGSIIQRRKPRKGDKKDIPSIASLLLLSVVTFVSTILIISSGQQWKANAFVCTPTTNRFVSQRSLLSTTTTTKTSSIINTFTSSTYYYSSFSSYLKRRHRHRLAASASSTNQQTIDNTTSVSSSSTTTKQKQKQKQTKKGNNKNKSKSSASSSTKEKEEEATEHKIELEPCNVVFTHTNADFDSLAAAVALSLLWSKHQRPELPTHVVLPRGTHPVVQKFLAFHKHLLPLRGFKTIQPEDVHAIGVVDAQADSRIGRGQAWLDYAQSIHIYDHHDGCTTATTTKTTTSSSKASLLNRATEVVIDKVGSTTTLLVEKLIDAGIKPAPHEATLFCLGIRADTGGLLYESTTLRDAAALLWCMKNGASQSAISEFGVTKITGDTQRVVLQNALRDTHTQIIHGLRISSCLVQVGDGHDGTYVAGMAQVCEEIMDLTDSDVFILGATHTSGRRGGRGGKGKKGKGGGNNNKKKSNTTQWISLIGRASARAVGIDLNLIMQQFEGGGHPKAAAAALRCKSNDEDPDDNDEDDDNGDSKKKEEICIDSSSSSLSSVKDELVRLANIGQLSPEIALETAVELVQDQIPEQLVASSFMNSNIRTVDMDYTVDAAYKLFDKYNLKSAPIVDQYGKFKSSLKLSDIVNAVRAGRTNDKIKSMIRPGIRTVLPDTDLADLEHLLIHEGVGRIPVIDDEGILLGMITRTDVLRQHNFYEDKHISG